MDIIWQGLEPQSKPAWALQQNIMMPWPALQLPQHRYQKAIARASTQWENSKGFSSPFFVMWQFPAATWHFFDSATWSFQAMTCQSIMTLWQLRDLSINHDALAIARSVNQPWRSGNCGRFYEISLGRSTISWLWKRRFFRPWKSCFSTIRKVGNIGPYPTHAAHGITLVIVVT